MIQLHYQDLDSLHLSLFIRSQDGCNSSSYYTFTVRSRGRKGWRRTFPKSSCADFPSGLPGWKCKSHDHVCQPQAREDDRRHWPRTIMICVLGRREEGFWKEATNSNCYRVLRPGFESSVYFSPCDLKPFTFLCLSLLI